MKNLIRRQSISFNGLFHGQTGRSGQTAAVDYVYDSAGNRLSATTQLGTKYSSLGDRLSVNGVQYTLGINAGLTQVLDDGTNTYTYGLGRISQTDTSTEYFLGDALGSVRQLTAGNGDVTLTKSYDPYGVITTAGGTSQTVYGFTGEYQGDSTELIYLRARYYNPSDGRFQSQDTWAGNYNAPQSLNRWNYVEGNPVNRSDPSGHCYGNGWWDYLFTRPYGEPCPNVIAQQQAQATSTAVYATEISNARTQLAPTYTPTPTSTPTFTPTIASTPDINNYNPVTPPSGITFDPSMDIPLASYIPVNGKNAQNVDGMGVNLCGLIDLTMLPDANTKAILDAYYAALGENAPNAQSSYDLLYAALKVLQGKWVGNANYWSQQLHLTSADISPMKYSSDWPNSVPLKYWNQTYSPWQGDNSGDKAAQSLNYMLQQQRYVIVYANLSINYSTGFATLTGQSATGRWVFLTGMSQNWDYQNESSPMNWVSVNNPYNNRQEYYPWSLFKQSISTSSGWGLLELWQQ